jgi:hypothetical protein
MSGTSGFAQRVPVKVPWRWKFGSDSARKSRWVDSSCPMAAIPISAKRRTLNQQHPPPLGAMKSDIPWSTRRVSGGGPTDDIKVRRHANTSAHRAGTGRIPTGASGQPFEST